MSPSSTVHGGNYVAKNAPCEETSRGREFPPFNLKQLVSIQCPRHFLEVDLENMAHVFYGPLPARYILLFLLAKKIFLFCEDVFKETFGSPSRSAKNKKKKNLFCQSVGRGSKNTCENMVLSSKNACFVRVIKVLKLRRCLVTT